MTFEVQIDGLFVISLREYSCLHLRDMTVEFFLRMRRMYQLLAVPGPGDGAGKTQDAGQLHRHHGAPPPASRQGTVYSDGMPYGFAESERKCQLFQTGELLVLAGPRQGGGHF